MKKFNNRAAKIELTQDEQDLLINRISEFSPRNIVEVGVFRGGVSKLILDSFKNINLHSFDLCGDSRVGNLCDPMIYKNWNLHIGSYTYKEINKINESVDCLFLDTDHVLPGEILDFLMVYPKLIRNHKCLIFIHDINLPLIKSDELFSIAPRLLFSVIPEQEKKEEIDNLGFIVTDVNKINPLDILNLLMIPWSNLDILNETGDLLHFFNQNYDTFFCKRFKEIINSQIRNEVRKYAS